MKKLILLIFVLCLIPIVLAKPVSIENTDFKIRALEETIYCTNIWSSEGCLFKAQIEVISKQNKNTDVKPFIDYDRQIKVKEVQEKKKKESRNINRNKGRNFEGSFNQIKARETELIEVEFWSWESGIAH